MRRRQKLTDFFTGVASTPEVTAPTPPSQQQSSRGSQRPFARSANSSSSSYNGSGSQTARPTSTTATATTTATSTSATAAGVGLAPPPHSLDMRLSASSLSQLSRPNSGRSTSEGALSESNSAVTSPRVVGGGAALRGIVYSKRESVAFSEELRVASVMLWKETLRRARQQHNHTTSTFQAAHPQPSTTHTTSAAAATAMMLSPRFAGNQPADDMSLLLPAGGVRRSVPHSRDEIETLKRTLSPDEATQQLFAHEEVVPSGDEMMEGDLPEARADVLTPGGNSSSKKSADDQLSHGTPSCFFSQIGRGGKSKVKTPLSEATEVQRALLCYQAQTLLNQKLFDQDPYAQHSSQPQESVVEASGKNVQPSTTYRLNVADGSSEIATVGGWGERDSLELVRCAKRLIDELANRQRTPMPQPGLTPVAQQGLGSSSSSRSPRTVVVTPISGGLNLRKERSASTSSRFPQPPSFETQGGTSSASEDAHAHSQPLLHGGHVPPPPPPLRVLPHLGDGGGMNNSSVALHLDSSESNHLIDPVAMTFVRVWKERNEALRWFQHMNALLEGSTQGLLLPLGMFGIPPSVLLQCGSDTVSVTWLPPLSTGKTVPLHLNPELTHWSLTDFTKRLWGASSSLAMVSTARLKCGEAVPPVSVLKHIEAMQSLQLCEGADGRCYAMNFAGPVHIPSTRTTEGHAKCHRMARLYQRLSDGGDYASALGYSVAIVGEFAHCLSVTMRDASTQDQTEALLRSVKEQAQEAFQEVERAYRWDSGLRSERNQTGSSVAPAVPTIARQQHSSPRSVEPSPLQGNTNNSNSSPATVAAHLFQQPKNALPPLLVFHRHSDMFLYLEVVANSQWRFLKQHNGSANFVVSPSLAATSSSAQDPLHMPGLTRKTSASSLDRNHNGGGAGINSGSFAGSESLLNVAAKLSREQTALTAMLYEAAVRLSPEIVKSRAGLLRRVVRSATNFVGMQQNGNGLNQDRLLVAERLRFAAEQVVESAHAAVIDANPPLRRTSHDDMEGVPLPRPAVSSPHPFDSDSKGSSSSPGVPSLAKSSSFTSSNHLHSPTHVEETLDAVRRALLSTRQRNSRHLVDGGSSDSSTLLALHSQLLNEAMSAWGKTLRATATPSSKTSQNPTAVGTVANNTPEAEHALLSSADAPLLPFSSSLHAFAQIAVSLFLPVVCSEMQLLRRIAHKNDGHHGSTKGTRPRRRGSDEDDPWSYAGGDGGGGLFSGAGALLRSHQTDLCSIASEKPDQWIDEVRTYRSWNQGEVESVLGTGSNGQHLPAEQQTSDEPVLEWSVAAYSRAVIASMQLHGSLAAHRRGSTTDAQSFLLRAQQSRPAATRTFVGDIFLMGGASEMESRPGTGTEKSKHEEEDEAAARGGWTVEALASLRQVTRDVLLPLMDCSSYHLQRSQPLPAATAATTDDAPNSRLNTAGAVHALTATLPSPTDMLLVVPHTGGGGVVDDETDPSTSKGVLLSARPHSVMTSFQSDGTLPRDEATVTCPKLQWNERVPLCGVCPQLVLSTLCSVDRCVPLAVTTTTLTDPCILSCYVIALFPVLWYAEHEALHSSVRPLGGPSTLETIRNGGGDQHGDSALVVPLVVECRTVARIVAYLRALQHQPKSWIASDSAAGTKAVVLSYLSKLLAATLAEACVDHGVDVIASNSVNGRIAPSPATEANSVNNKTANSTHAYLAWNNGTTTSDRQPFAPGIQRLQSVRSAVMTLFLSSPPSSSHDKTGKHAGEEEGQQQKDGEKHAHGGGEGGGASTTSSSFLSRLRVELEGLEDPAVQAYLSFVASQLQLKRSAAASSSFNVPGDGSVSRSVAPVGTATMTSSAEAGSLLARHAGSYRFLVRLLDPSAGGTRRASMMTTTETLVSIQSLGLPLDTPAPPFFSNAASPVHGMQGLHSYQSNGGGISLAQLSLVRGCFHS